MMTVFAATAMPKHAQWPTKLSALLSSLLLLAVMLFAGTANANEAPCEDPIPRRMLLGCGGGGGGGRPPPSAPPSVPPATPANECRVTFSRRGYEPFSKASVQRFVGAQHLWTASETSPNGPLEDGGRIRVYLPSLTNYDLRTSIFVVSTDGNSERCHKSPKQMMFLLDGETSQTSHWSTCETTFWHTKSVWRCKTHKTFRFQLRLECLDDGVWEPRHFRSGERDRPQECDGCLNCF